MKRHPGPRLGLMLILAMGLSAGMALAVPQRIDYQGKLTDAAGTPIDAATSMVFRIWNHVSAGSVVWVETQAVVNIESGLFHVNLGEVRPIPEGLFDTDPLYLSIQVGTDAQMTPRLPLQSVPYAQRALTAAYAGQASSASYATTAGYSDGPWATSGANVYRTNGNVGIGRSTPAEALHVYRATGDAKVQIQAFAGDADLVIDNALGNPTVEFQRNGVYGAGVGYDPVNDYAFLYHNGSLVFKNGRLGIGTSSPTNSLEVNGTVKVTGQCRGTYPRPNYDSGWVALSVSCDVANGIQTLTHNLGGNVDNYVVDLMSKDTGEPVDVGINNHGIGTFQTSGGDERGFFYKQLTTNSVTIFREDCDSSSHQVRVRIWVYN